METLEKIRILADSAKYDVSCSSSGSTRRGVSGSLGNALKSGICHSWSADGRCISLLKILMTNVCAFDCAYCRNRRSNDIPRAAFTPEEIVDLTVSLYRRNYIEGLFLSSGILGDPEKTMALMVQAARLLRIREGFNGYIHLKGIPGASWETLNRAAFFADRMSLNIELPSAASLGVLAPQKTKRGILAPMMQIGDQSKEIQLRRDTKFSRFLPAGQTTQMIIGASPESDLDIIKLSGSLYKRCGLRRVYYSAYVPVNRAPGLPEPAPPPLRREHRLYQADWLLRFYRFAPEEVLDPGAPWLDPAIDPKAAWAVRNRDFFPLDAATADYEQLLRVPGLGVISAQRIVAARRSGTLSFDILRKMGVVIKRAKYFLLCDGRAYEPGAADVENVRGRLARSEPGYSGQLQLFNEIAPVGGGTA